MSKLIFACLLLVASVSAGAVRETETPGYFIHIPIAKEKLRDYLVAPLVPDIFEGQAYVQVAFFHISKLESRIFGTFINNLLTGDCARTSALVYDPRTKSHGYMILSADFAQDIAGKIAMLGCSQTNWMICGSSTFSISDKSLQSTVADSVGVYAGEIGSISSKPLSNTTFWRWSQVERDFRFEQSVGKTYYQVRPSTNKGVENKDAKLFPFTLNSWKSTLFTARFSPELAEADKATKDVCANDRCIKASSFTFVDGDSKTEAAAPRLDRKALPKL